MGKQVKIVGVKLNVGWLGNKTEFEIQECVAEEKPKTYKVEGERLFGNKVLTKEDEGVGLKTFSNDSFVAFSSTQNIPELKQVLVKAYLAAVDEELKRLHQQIAAKKVKIGSVLILAKQEGIEL